MNNNQPSNRIAKIIKGVSAVIIAILTIVGFCVGYSVMDSFSPVFPLYPIGGALIGGGIGFAAMLLMLFLAELGTNTKKTAEAAMQTAKSSSAEEIKRYKELLDSGIISEEEFEEKKKQLLGL